MTEQYYGYTKEQHEFAEREINKLALANEFQELYAHKNECWTEDLSNFYNKDGEMQEIFQWYLVDTYQAERLKDLGEPVLETADNYLWGRTCCGQAIILDGTFQNIHKAILPPTQ